MITRDHISRALEQKRLGLVSERDLVYWATMLLLNDAYELDPKDEDFVAEWLNDISYSLDATARLSLGGVGRRNAPEQVKALRAWLHSA